MQSQRFPQLGDLVGRFVQIQVELDLGWLLLVSQVLLVLPDGVDLRRSLLVPSMGLHELALSGDLIVTLVLRGVEATLLSPRLLLVLHSSVIGHVLGVLADQLGLIAR